MIVWHRKARQAAQWVVDAVMGNGLAQQQNEQDADGGTTPEVAALARRAAAEGCVLIANDGTLPLDPAQEIAVFGRTQLDWFHIGHGSGGDVHPPYATNLMDGLAQAHVRYNLVLAEVYRSWCASDQHAADPGWWGHWPAHHPEMPVDARLAQAAAQTADVAVVALGRTAGEDLDLRPVPGDYYLTPEEEALLDVVTAAFQKTVVVLNSGNLIDLSWVQRHGNKISAVLLAWQGGMEAGSAVADVLCGTVNPSGRLAATAACSHDAYPCHKTFGRAGHVDYTEDVFVGYRHFLSKAPADVLYPFGHGLSYTTFSSELLGVELCEDEVRASVRVTNTGARTGAHAVLLWCAPPTRVRERPSCVLAAFGRTGELAPNETQVVELACNLKTIASFDDKTHAFVLDAGAYLFWPDDETVKDGFVLDEDRVLQVCSPICLTSKQLRERILAELPAELLAELPVGDKDGVGATSGAWAGGGPSGGSEAGGAGASGDAEAGGEPDHIVASGNAEAGGKPGCDELDGDAANDGELNRDTEAGDYAAGGEPNRGRSADVRTTVGLADGTPGSDTGAAGSDADDDERERRDVTFADVACGHATLDEFVTQLDDDELEELSRGEGAMNSTLGVPGNAGAFGGVTKRLRARSIPAAICADGPSGARLQRRCSLLPCATALACTWDTDLVRDLYAAVGGEIRKAGVDVLLAPGMNIQRSPLCGRNFEYFSEDPLLSGRMAGAVVRGLQSAGVSACPKHFACNNQEARRNTSDSRVSERALREIYLRGFELCVREARPDLVMTSYNKVNGVWAHYHYDLVSTVLRKEWGFGGVVITDWWMRPARSPEFRALRDNAYRLRAGVDVLMPGSMSHVLSVPHPARGVTRGELQRTARHVLAYLLGRNV